MHWFLKVKEVMTGNNLVQCPFEPTLFKYIVDGMLCGFIMIHVDDFLFSGTENFVKGPLRRCLSSFTVGKESVCPLPFTDVLIKPGTSSGEICIDQSFSVEKTGAINGVETSNWTTTVGQLSNETRYFIHGKFTSHRNQKSYRASHKYCQ